MYPAKPGLLIGFHGCEQAVRDEIIAGKRVMHPSKNRHDWLGSGIYFWENNYARAMDFATNRSIPSAAYSSKDRNSIPEQVSMTKTISRSASGTQPVLKDSFFPEMR